MKKLFFSAVALVSLFFAASCQQENLEPVNASSTVTYTVQVPDVVATKALGDDVTPVNELVYEVYRTEGERVTTFTDVDNLLYHRTAPVNNGVATITLELVNDQNFTVLFWAQTKVLEDQTPIYNVDDLTNVTVSRNAVANNVNAAAFVGRDFIINCVSDSDCKVTLTRPVSQLNIATTQESLTKFNDVVVLEGSSVVVKGLSQDYNVATLTPGELNDNEYTYTETVVPTDVLKVGETDYVYVGMNYVGFAPQLGATLTVSYVINTTEGNIDNIIENVPVKPNYRTNIIGNLITSTSDYVVELDKTWAGEFISADSADEFVAALNTARSGDIVYVAEGEYNLPVSLFDQATEGTFTIAGQGENTVMKGAVSANGGNPANYANGKHLVLKDLTYVTANNGYNGGFGHAASVTFINCEIVGQFYAHSSAPHYFYDCTIDPLTGYLYTYSSDCVFEGCTFAASEGRALQIYEDGSVGENTVTIKDCNFVAAKQAQTWDNKPVTGIDINSNGAIFNVVVENCTTTGFPTGLNSGSDLYNIKDGGLAYTNLTVDGVVVNRAGGYAKHATYSNIWVKDNNYYVFDKAGLADLNAYFAANSMNNVLWSREYHIAADIDASGYTWNSVYVVVGNNANNGLVIDGNGHTISNLTLNGSMFTGTPNGGNDGTTPGYVKNITVDNATVTGDHWTAVFWGNSYGELVYENVTVKNTSVTGNCNTAIFLGGTVYEDTKGVDNILFKNCKVENCSVVANGKDGQDPTGASVFCGRAYGKTRLTFEGNVVDDATTVVNKNGLVGGMYGYTMWYGSGFVSTGAANEIADWTGVELAAVVGDKVCNTLVEAASAAKAGDTIKVLNDTSFSGDLELPAGVILDGNGKQINGRVYAGGDLTVVGHTKVTYFMPARNNATLTIGDGACLEVTGGDRATFGYGDVINVTGTLENAKETAKENIQPSLIIPGFSITGAGNSATFNITNAYVKIGNTTSKNSVANGVFTLNITNSIAEFTNQFTFAEPTSGKNPTFNVNVTNSVLTTVAKLCIAAPNTTFNVDNSTITLGTYFRNSGVFNLVNGSALTGKTIQFGENGGNNGAITVDNSSLTVIGGTGHPFDGQGIGSITLQNGAYANVDYYKDMTINVDATSTFTGTEL